MLQAEAACTNQHKRRLHIDEHFFGLSQN